MKCLKLGSVSNIVLRCAMYSTVRDYPEEATQHNGISIHRLATATVSTQSFGIFVS